MILVLLTSGSAIVPQRSRVLQGQGLRPEHLVGRTQIDEDNLDLLGMVGALDQQSRCQPPDSWGIAARY